MINSFFNLEYNLDMNNFFNRWSLNLFGLLGVSSIFIIFYSVILWFYIQEKIGYSCEGCGVVALFFYCVSLFFVQALILITTLLLLIKERNPNFRIKKQLLLKLCNNIYYRVLISILAIIELVIMISSTIIYVKIQP